MENDFQYDHQLMTPYTTINVNLVYSTRQAILEMSHGSVTVVSHMPFTATNPDSHQREVSDSIDSNRSGNILCIWTLRGDVFLWMFFFL